MQLFSTPNSLAFANFPEALQTALPSLVPGYRPAVMQIYSIMFCFVFRQDPRVLRAYLHYRPAVKQIYSIMFFPPSRSRGFASILTLQTCCNADIFYHVIFLPSRSRGFASILTLQTCCNADIFYHVIFLPSRSRGFASILTLQTCCNVDIHAMGYVAV